MLKMVVCLIVALHMSLLVCYGVSADQEIVSAEGQKVADDSDVGLSSHLIRKLGTENRNEEYLYGKWPK